MKPLFLNLIITNIEFEELTLKIFYEYKGRKKFLKFINVKKFSSVISEHIFYDSLLENLEIDDFSKVFYRYKPKNEIYILDGNWQRVIIQFNEEKEWKYREQKN